MGFGRWKTSLRSFRRHAQRAGLTILLAALILYVLQWPTNFLILRPGQALPVGPMITINGEGGNSHHLLMTTVMTHRATLGVAVLGAIHPGMDMYHLSRFLKPGQTIEEYYQQNQWLMQDSQALAIALAFKQLGYSAEVVGDGALVAYVAPDGPAHGLLASGDTITACTGVVIRTGPDLLGCLSEVSSGRSVTLQFVREGSPDAAELVTGPHPDDAERAYLGISVLTAQPQVQGPHPVSIDAGEVGGPSAGLMFTLEIISRYRGNLLPPGWVIAGTGILDRHGQVNPVGGVRQKVQAAERSGAQVFLAPAANYREALRAARSIQVVSVESLDEAIQRLVALDKAS